jgi:hypothetical protein
MREIRPSGSEGGAAQINAPFLPLSGFQRLRLHLQQLHTQPRDQGDGYSDDEANEAI